MTSFVYFSPSPFFCSAFGPDTFLRNTFVRPEQKTWEKLAFPLCFQNLDKKKFILDKLRQLLTSPSAMLNLTTTRFEGIDLAFVCIRVFFAVCS